jgi:hypothetical protein
VFILKTGEGVVDWIGLAQDRYRWRTLVNAVMNLQVPWNAGKLPSGCTSCGLSTGTKLLRVRPRVHTLVRRPAALGHRNCDFLSSARQILGHNLKLGPKSILSYPLKSTRLGLMLWNVRLESKGLRRWCMTLRITGFLDFVHRPEF